jgi:hypothetical protein
MSDPLDDDWSFWPDFGEEPTPRPPPRPRQRGPAPHRALLTNGDTIYLFGVLSMADELLPVPMISFHAHVVCVLPQCCVIERWCGDEGWGRDWVIVYGPPAGTDTEWLRSHEDWAA